MKQLAIAFIAFVVFFASCKEATQMDQPTAYKYDYQVVENDPTGTMMYTLDNGLTVYLSVNKMEPRIQTLIAVRAGSKYDPAETTGLAHYLEHMVFKGTHTMGTKDWESEKVLLDQIAATYEEHRLTDNPEEKAKLYARIDSLSYEASKFAIANEYDKMISSLGANGTNAYTSFDETVYVNDIPSNEMEKWLMVEAERFQTLVLRLFHTELETVYEEFNRSQDSDQRWTYQKVLEGLMPNHPYGTQTTIGRGEDLKNPSMYNIYEYFDTYYRPNNVAICLSGDLDPDATIDMIKQYFGTWEAKEIPDFKMPEVFELDTPQEKYTYGPQQEMVYMGFRFDGAGSKDATMAQLVDMVLANSQAGLIDLDLNLSQKVLSAGSFPMVLHDHTVHFLYGLPKEGQTLEEVKDLLLGEIEKIKAGDFDEWLVEAVVNDLKLSRMKLIESNKGRAGLMVDAFINELPFEEVIFEYDRMAGISKQDIVDFTKANYNNNYVVSYKEIGEPNRHSVPKPNITKVELDRESKSAFYQAFDTLSSEPIEPKFIDFSKDIAFSTLNGLEMAYVENEQNKLFNLYYIFDMGSDHSKELALAINYLPYLETSQYSAAELKQEFYKLAVSFDVSASRDKVYVTLSGLEENLAAGVALFEHVLSDVTSDEEVYQEMVNDILKSRNDAKLNKSTILSKGLVSYAKYGQTNPFTDKLSEEELRNVDVVELVSIIRNLTGFEHRIFYYGSKTLDEAKKIIAAHHEVPNSFIKMPEAMEYPENDFKEAQVLFTPYDMQQVEMLMLSKDVVFDPSIMASAALFNEYFGAGLSSIVFQEIREQKALAYAAYAYYASPAKKEDYHYVQAYIGTQSDKLAMAVDEMILLMNNMPEATMQFEAAKEAVIKKLQTDWITGQSIYWQYENAKKRGLDEDVRQQIYEQVQTMTIADLRDFFNQHVKDQSYTFCVIGKEENIDKSVLEEIGSFQQLSLEEIFGY